MTRRVLALTAVILVLAVVGWLAAAASGTSEPLRSRHSDPTIAAPPPLVAVTRDGKLYHRRECTFVHGPIHTESLAQAISEGYTPCRRCMAR
jgi:hypothetical protein